MIIMLVMKNLSNFVRKSHFSENHPIFRLIETELCSSNKKVNKDAELSINVES